MMPVPAACRRVMAALAVSLLTSQAVGADVCFTPAENAHLPFQVFQEAPPPRAEGQGDYNFYPATAVATMQLGELNDTKSRSVGLYYWQWGNHATEGVISPTGRSVVRKVNNFQPGRTGPRQARSAFSSIARADACTLAQTAAVLGRPAEAEAALRRAGVGGKAESSLGPEGVEGARDVCVIPSETLSRRVEGIVLDYEVADGRSPSHTLAFLSEYAALVHMAGKRVFLNTNPLDAPTQAYTGVTSSNAGQLLRTFDNLSILLWSRNRQGDIGASFRTQMAILGPHDPSRVIVVFELANTSLADARLVRSLIISNHLGGVMFWRDYAKQGGDCSTDVNRKIACLVYGHCS